jgi:hypothetical protein
LKEERWRQTFEATKAALPDDQMYYGYHAEQPRKHKRYTVEEHERTIDLRAQGKTWVEISEDLGRGAVGIWMIGTSLLTEERWMKKTGAWNTWPLRECK